VTSTAAAVAGHPNNWNFVGELSPEQAAHPIARGKIIGGSSAINGAVFIRGRPIDFDSLAALGHDLRSYGQVLPFFNKSETDLSFASPFHGQDGPMPVSHPTPERTREVSEAFVEACVNAGFQEEPDKNRARHAGGNCRGSGPDAP
jgi:choline dehydrogenase-like flavoprotein